MRYITAGEIDGDNDYLLIGYKNRFDQFDVAKLKISLISSYYVPNERVQELSARLDALSNFLSTALTKLSVDEDKITVMELSAYCSRARLDEMLDERTFNRSENFMNYLIDKFQTKDDVKRITCLANAGAPLAVAAGKIKEIFDQAYKKNKKQE